MKPKKPVKPSRLERPVRPAGPVKPVKPIPTVKPVKTAVELVRAQRDAIQSDARRFYASPENQQLFGERLRAERPVHDSTFLFIGAVPGDEGSRPLAPGTVYWNSARLVLRDGSGAVVAAGELLAGTSYELHVVVNNGGDLDAHSAKVEALLAPLRLGLGAGPVELLGVQSLQVAARGEAHAAFSFTATPAMEGDRAVLARTFSFANNDLPADADAFAVAADRHLGQQSLVIRRAASSEAFSPLHFDITIGAALAGRPLSLVLRRNADALDLLRGFRTLQSAAAAPPTPFKAFPISVEKPDGSLGALNATAEPDGWKAGLTLGQGTSRLTMKFAGIDVPSQHAAVFDAELTSDGTSQGGFQFVLARP